MSCDHRHAPAEAPQNKAKAAVRVQTDGDLSGWVQLTLQLHGPTEGSHGIMGHLERGSEKQTSDACCFLLNS